MVWVGGPGIHNFRKLGCHRGVTSGELLDRHILRLVVGQAKVSVRVEEGILGFLQIGYGLINCFDCICKAIGGQLIVTCETLLERIKLALKICDVDVLRLYYCKLGLVLERVFCGASRTT